MQTCPDMGQFLSLQDALPDARFIGSSDVRATGCACDWRSLKPGDAYVALPGSRDGRRFIAEAIARGCSAIVLEQPAPELPSALPICLVPNAREAYGRLHQALAGNPSRQLKLIAVAGATGKTTASCLIAGILKAAGRRVGLMGSLGYFDGETAHEAAHITPPTDRSAALLARMAQNGCSHAVIEVSNRALEESRVAGMSFDAACITRIGHSQQTNQIKLLEHLSSEGFVVLNGDDPFTADLLPKIDGPALTVGIHSAAEITGTLVERFSGEQTFILSAGSDSIPVRTRIIGDQHIYNCLIAAAVGLAYGIDLPTVARGLESVEYVPGRLERIECGQPFSVFVDFARGPAALKSVLQTLREVTTGRLLCVFGAGGRRDAKKGPLMGRAVELHADVAVVAGDNPCNGNSQAIIDDILSGFTDPAAAKVFPHRAEALYWTLSNARPGDCVLIAGKGCEDYRSIDDETTSDDCHLARQWLYEEQPYAVSSGEWRVGSG
jgi:UDP-N-acetylmuramoyl-L-alanyl-D-glutamate--2,6-diaminopimelate ligase